MLNNIWKDINGHVKTAIESGEKCIFLMFFFFLMFYALRNACFIAGNSSF